MKRIVATMIIAAALVGGRPASAQVEQFTNQSLLKDFVTIALGSEYEARKSKTVLKWLDPIRAVMIGKGYPDYLETMVRDQFADLAYETGHSFEIHYSPRLVREKRLPKNASKIKTNLVIVYGPRDKLAGMIDNVTKGKYSRESVQKILNVAVCLARVSTKKDALSFAVIGYPSEHPRHILRKCVVEELTQVMGLINDSTLVNPSIFNDDDRYKELTLHDRWLLRMLYNPEIKPGMDAKTAVELSRKFLQRRNPE